MFSGLGLSGAARISCWSIDPLTRAVRAFVAAIVAGDSAHPSLALGVDVVGVLADCAGLIDR